MDEDHLQRALAAINERRPNRFQLKDRFEVGAKGAYRVTGVDGVAAVLKVWPNGEDTRAAQAIRLPRIERLRQVGWPIPGLLEAGVAAEVLFELWEMAPGAPGVEEVVPIPVIEQARELIGLARGRGLGDGTDWPGWLAQSIERSMARAQPNAGPDARNLLEFCRHAISECDLPPGRDIIHGDFTPANCLLAHDSIVTVVDFDDCRDGDGTLDLAGFAWDLEGWQKTDSSVLDGLWREVRELAGSRANAMVLLAFWVAGSLAWSAGTEDESAVVDCSRRAIARAS